MNLRKRYTTIAPSTLVLGQGFLKRAVEGGKTLKLIYNVNDKPKFSENIVFAFQQMIAIMAATLLVPMLMSTNMMSNGTTLYFDPAAALFGAGAGTLFYIFVTKKKSPVFLGSSFTFLPCYTVVIGMNYGYWGVIIGVAMAGLVYVAMALIIKAVGSGWVNKLLPPEIAGPIVALIGLSLSSTATGWASTNGGNDYSLIFTFLAIITFLVICFVSEKGGKFTKLIPFIIGVGAGYIIALILTLTGVADLIDLSAFGNMTIFSVPKFTFIQAITQHPEGLLPINAAALGNIALAFVPIAVVELAQHVGDHKNLGSIIDADLITDPGLDRTLVGDGVGSAIGAFFGGAANTTYGESIACVAITGNASTNTISLAAVMCMILSFCGPFVTIINTIPKCVMGGACIALYGFIAVSGLKMIQQVDLNDNKNLYPVSAILVCGLGGLTLNFGFNPVTGGALLQLSALATALLIGLITKKLVSMK